MFVVIAGGGRTATQLATLLIGQDHKICLVEHRPEVLARLHRELPTEAIVEGISTDPYVLEQAGIAVADVMAAMLTEDAENLALCYLARTRYKVPRIIGRINDPRNAWLFDEKFHVDVALNHAQVLASLIEEEMSLGDMMTLLKLRRGQYSLVEEKVLPEARMVGMEIKDLGLPEHCIITAVIRHGDMVLPRGTTVLEAGDEILAVTDLEGMRRLNYLFAPRSGGE